jgi:hypothetical protein
MREFLEWWYFLCCHAIFYTHAERAGDVDNTSRWWEAQTRATFAKRSGTAATAKPYEKVNVEQYA